MSRLVVLSLGQGNLKDGFNGVTVQLWEQNNSYGMKFSASLPPAPEIRELYRNWRSLYSSFYQRLGLRLNMELDDDLEIEANYITNVSEVELNDLCEQLENSINAWLNSTPFHKIDQQLRTALEPSAEIRFLIETNDHELRRLPWHLWSFFADYPYAEVGLSAAEYQQPNITTGNREEKVKILAIFGDSQGIEISQDRTFLENLSHQAEIDFLVEPRLDDLSDRLWKQGWDILFFAGHSCTKEKGLLQINPTDTLSLDQLKYALKKAIAGGLKLAIFNSCDGLGLAQELQTLQIPQVIVMREPIPDVVAQKFLKYFLAEFSRGQSLYTAVRYARERLQALENEYPCATWLPVICQNPATSPMIWLQKAKKIIASPQIKAENLVIKNQLHIPTLLIASFLAATLIMGVRYIGILQPWELQSYDHLMQLRSPDEKSDSRLLIVTIDEADIQYQIQQKMNMRWSLSDEALTQVLQKLDAYQPQAIGIDIYHDFPVDRKYPELATRLQSDDRLFTVCKVAAPGDNAPDGISPPPSVPRQRQSFSDVVADEGDMARRQLLHLTPHPTSACVAEYSFSFQLAQHYLNHKGIKWRINSQKNLQIGEVEFKQLQSHSSGYQKENTSGYQIPLNYRSLSSPQKIARQVSLKDILTDKINPQSIEEVKNRIVLIGVTASSSSDYWQTPYSSNAPDNEKQIPGVFVQAQMISQILSAVLDKRPLIWWWSGWIEALWIWGWSLLGGIIGWRIVPPFYLGLAIALALITIFGICFSIFTQGGWIPLVPSALALITSAVVLKILPRHPITKS